MSGGHVARCHPRVNANFESGIAEFANDFRWTKAVSASSPNGQSRRVNGDHRYDGSMFAIRRAGPDDVLAILPRTREFNLDEGIAIDETVLAASIRG